MAAAPAVAAAILITDSLHRVMQHALRKKVTLRAHHIHEALNLQPLHHSFIDIATALLTSPQLLLYLEPSI